jgi:NAD+ kinase
MKIALYGRTLSPEHRGAVYRIFDWLRSHNLHVLIYEPYKILLAETHHIVAPFQAFHSSDDLGEDVDCLLSLGGDGTMLDTVMLIQDKGIPIIGLNLGRLGFLSSVQEPEFEQALNDVLERRYSLDHRSLLTVVRPIFHNSAEHLALNEVTILKKDSSSMIQIHAYLNEEFFNTYWADGLIIATPTGSTGYSMSCGGPIIMPESSSFVLTPIAPHNLNVRPVIISDDAEIRLKVESRHHTFLMSLDSRSYFLSADEEIVIKKAAFGINLIKLHSQSHIVTLRNKLLWGIDKRN